VRRILACLLLAILPLTPSWAGVAIDCGRGGAIAPPSASTHAVDAAVPAEDAGHDDCCAEAAAIDVQCGPDCENCHTLGNAMAASPAIAVAVLPPARGDSIHAGRLPEPPPGGTFRPPAPAID
jgi:hypothetical protein